MTQLIINGTSYPKASRDTYKCYEVDEGTLLQMASGRYVYEARGKRTVIEYTYDYFPDDLAKTCLADLRSGSELEVSYMTPDGTELNTEFMRCTQFPTPTFAFGRGATAYWHNFSFKLEAVDCHD